MKLKPVIIAILVLLALIIVFLNTQVVTFNLLFGKFSMSLIVMLIIVMLLGFIIGFLVRPTIMKKKDQ